MTAPSRLCLVLAGLLAALTMPVDGDTSLSRVEKRLPQLPSPYTLGGLDCPPGRISRGVYCTAHGPVSLYHQVCAKLKFPDVPGSQEFVHEPKGVRMINECPVGYVCCPHGPYLARAGLWSPFLIPPQPMPRIDCVEPHVRMDRLRAIAEARRPPGAVPKPRVRRPGMNDPVYTPVAKRGRPRRNRPPSDGASGSGTVPDPASISAFHALRPAPVPDSPGVSASVSDSIGSIDFNLVDADISAVMFNDLEHDVEYDVDAVRSIEGFLNGEPVCSSAATSSNPDLDDVAATVCTPTRSVEVRQHDRIEFTVEFDRAPGVDPQILWDALGRAQDKTP